jgi:hypothetical protein
METKTYALTNGDLKKIGPRINWTEIEESKPADTKSRQYRRWSMRKRDAALCEMRGTIAYMQGKGQGALDLAMGFDYAAKTEDRAYNCGYHTGYTNPSNLHDLVEHNENFSFLKK